MDFKYNSTTYFHVPIYFDSNVFGNIDYIYKMLLNSEYNRGDIKLIGYGCPNNCIWNGGRLILGQQYDIETLYLITSIYKELLEDMQFTFTNFMLQSSDVFDRYGNALLNIAHEFDIEILVCSDILENYIRKIYPDMRIARSIINTNNLSQDDFKKYSTIVVSKYKNKDLKYLKKLNADKGNTNLELLVDETCGINCPRRAREHYQAYNMSQLYMRHNLCRQCTSEDKYSYKQIEILPEDINKYLKIDYNRFKLSGREDIAIFIESIIKYIIKEDEQQNLRMEFYKHMASMLDEQNKNQAIRCH